MALPKISTPKYELTIPSTGKSIEYRPYLVREEKLLMIALESADEMQMVSAIKQIVAACTFDVVDVNRLAMFDVEYIFAKLRAKSVGETAKVSLDCDKCEAKNNVTINIEDDINVTEQADPKIVKTLRTLKLINYLILLLCPLKASTKVKKFMMETHTQQKIR